jgi:CIC family chloride channel protein
MLGGLATGLVGVGLYLAVGAPQVLDVLSFGYGSLQQALAGQVPLVALMVLAGGKMLTTSLSIGSGGSGGVFGPSMVIGGSLGGIVGLIAQWAAPDLVTQPGAYVVVGMAGFFAAAANTPISTLVMVSEMTGNYRLLLPALWVCAIAYMVGRRWSLYRSQVPTPFQSPAHRRQYYVDLLEDTTVGDLLQPSSLDTIPETASLDDVITAFTRSTQEFFPVVDPQGRMTGLLSLRDVRKLLDLRNVGPAIIARDLATAPPPVLAPEDPATVALQRFVSLDVDELPVTRREAPHQVLGMLRRRDLVDAYNRRRLEGMKRRLTGEA